LLGVIISGSNGEFGFERQNGSVIEWFGDNPRFKPGFGIASNPYYQNIVIEGQRNTSIRAIYSYLDYDLFIQVLKDTLYIVLLIIAFAVLVLILDLNSKTGQKQTLARAQSQPETPSPAFRDSPDEFGEEPSEEIWDEEPEILPETDDFPKGLYTPRGIGWESYTKERLESELHRCATLEEDLVLIVIEARNTKFGEATFKKLAGETIRFFTQRDMIFEKGEQGICLIIPALNLDQGFAKSEEFRSKVQNNLIDPSGVPPYICIGLSSRSGRLVEADRLIFEASQALQKAKKDADSPIIAFKSDPEKYREFIKRKMKA
jgi:GGDEF domain-containing protein